MYRRHHALLIGSCPQVRPRRKGVASDLPSAFSAQNRTRHGRFGKDAWFALRQKQSPNTRAEGFVLPRSPRRVATPASIVDALKAAAGLRSRTRASFAWGCCVRGTYAPSDQAREITKSHSFTKPSRVLARFSLDDGNANLLDRKSKR